jgi:hypothetical protein
MTRRSWRHDRESDVKYIVMMFGDQASMMEMRSMEWIKDMIQFMGKVEEDLTRSGELVVAAGLADPSQAKTVRIGANGLAAATDGPFAESKESLAGYWIVDVVDEARAVEFARSIVDFTKGPIEVRQVMSGPPDELR